MPSEAVDRVLSRLWALDCNPKGGEAKGWDCKCPAHDDRNPSFKLSQGDDGRALVYCHKGCTIDQIASALAMDVRELFEPEEESIDSIEIEHYDYVNEHGEPLFQVVRFSPKKFRQRRPNGQWGIEGVRRVLYRLPQVLAAIKAGKRIHVVEGEKDVHALEAKGRVATTCPGGAGKWRDEYTEMLRGAREVMVIQDMDEPDKTGKRPGQEHAEQVRHALEDVVGMVKVFEPAVGKDVSEHFKAGYGISDFVPAGQARPHERLEVMSAREIMALPDPDTEGYLLGPLIYRGHRIVVGGWTGHGKTTFTMHMTAAACYGREFLKWRGKGDLKALVVDVEQGTRTVKRRIRETGLQESDRVKYLRVPDGLALNTDRDAILGMEKILHNGGFDLVLADPLYKLALGADLNDSRAATDLMRRFDEWRERFGFALLLPMHARKPKEDSGLSVHDLFGSSAWQWGAEMLLGIERKSQTMTWLHLWKDREGEIAESGRPIDTHWNIKFTRVQGYQLYAENQQDKLVELAPTPDFDRAKFIYELIRDNGGERTWNQIKDALFQARHPVNAGPLDTTLGKLGGYGIYKEKGRTKGENVYRLQDQLLQAMSPGGGRGSESSTAQEEGVAH